MFCPGKDQKVPICLTKALKVLVSLKLSSSTRDSDKSRRKNSLVEFVGLVLTNVRYIQDRPFCCASFAFLFYWSFATLLFMEAALAVNRWAAVCTHNLRWVIFVAIIST